MDRRWRSDRSRCNNVKRVVHRAARWDSIAPVGTVRVECNRSVVHCDCNSRLFDANAAADRGKPMLAVDRIALALTERQPNAKRAGLDHDTSSSVGWTLVRSFSEGRRARACDGWDWQRNQYSHCDRYFPPEDTAEGRAREGSRTVLSWLFAACEERPRTMME